MLYAALAQSPVLGGKALSVDSAAAQAMPGVRRVLATSSGVVVVADHFWQALQARNALKITWDPGVNAQLDNAAMRALLEARGDRAGAGARKDGDAVAALKGSAARLDAVYELPLLAHATMEPMNCTADVRSRIAATCMWARRCSSARRRPPPPPRGSPPIRSMS